MRLETIVLVAEIGRRRYELPLSVPDNGPTLGGLPARYDVRIDPAGLTPDGRELVVPIVVDRLTGTDALCGPIVARKDPP